MKPKTRIQKEVAKLIRRLPELTEKQTAYAFEHCFKHYAHRTKGGILTCTECGHRWKSEHPLAESVCGCTCPHCGKELEVLDTRKRVFKEMEYFSIITTCKQFQVIRFFAVHTERKVCQPAKYSINEVVQRCTLKDDISYLLPTWLSAGTGKLKRKHHFIGWQERTNKMKNKSCATNFATQQPFSLLLLLQEPFLLAERKKMCYLSMAANQSQYTNINSFILGYIY